MLNEVWDVKEYVTGLEVSPTGRCSLLEGLRINSLPRSSGGHPSVFGGGALSSTSSPNSKLSTVRLSVKSLS